MNWIYLVSGVVSLALLIYLFLALLHPEKFE
jgi:K+-transporting ATPase KdpF subunit